MSGEAGWKALLAEEQQRHAETAQALGKALARIADLTSGTAGPGRPLVRYFIGNRKPHDACFEGPPPILGTFVRWETALYVVNEITFDLDCCYFNVRLTKTSRRQTLVGETY